MVRTLERRDVEGARAWMVDHIRTGRRYVFEFIKKGTESRGDASLRGESPNSPWTDLTEMPHTSTRNTFSTDG